MKSLTMICRPRTIVAVAAAVLLGGCSDPVSITDTHGRSFSVRRGTDFDVTLQTVGPGEFASPPTMSSSVVRFLDVTNPQAVPAGPTQRFRFHAAERGRAIITFRHTWTTQIIEDTVEVR